MMDFTADEIARTIDHTLLRPEATPGEIDSACDDACRFGFYAVCVNPVYVARAARRLADHVFVGSNARRPVVASVAGFPLGASRSATKADEARRALDEGATEVDMVANIGALIEGAADAVTEDISTVAEAVHRCRSDGILKVILETRVLRKERIVLGCRCCVDGGADFVKTSTGFHPAGGADVEQVRLLCRHASPIPVKAAGGIRTAEDVIAMLHAGAARIGTSSGVAIVESLRR